MNPARVVKAVQSCLTPAALKKEYRGHPNPLHGHCFVASQAVWFLLGGKKAGWKGVTMKVDGVPHWFLRNERTGKVIDPTAGQFSRKLTYEGRGCGFQTRKSKSGTGYVPTGRAKPVIACARRRLRAQAR